MSDLMSMITCPGCGSQVEIDQYAKSSQEFCPTCDYPLFWATPPPPLVFEDGTNTDTTMRRLPGAGGKQTVASVACPTCMELNALDAVTCIRCGGPMVLVEAEPEPEPEREPEPELEPEPEPVFIEEPARDWRPWALLALLILTAIVLLIILLV
jgi:hypothetical protein